MSPDSYLSQKDFYELWPEKFQYKTNGVTQVERPLHLLYIYFVYCVKCFLEFALEKLNCSYWLSHLTFLLLINQCI